MSVFLGSNSSDCDFNDNGLQWVVIATVPCQEESTGRYPVPPDYVKKQLGGVFPNRYEAWCEARAYGRELSRRDKRWKSDLWGEEMWWVDNEIRLWTAIYKPQKDRAQITLEELVLSNCKQHSSLTLDKGHETTIVWVKR